MTYRSLEPPTLGYFVPQVDMNKHGNSTYSMYSDLARHTHNERVIEALCLDISISEASKGHTGLSRHPCLQNSLWKKQMITTKD